MDHHDHGPNCACSQYQLTQNDDNIYGLIEFESLKCMNESKKNSSRVVFRPEEEKYSFDVETVNCMSPPFDPELLFVIRFKEDVRLRAINFIGKPDALPTYLGV